MVLVWPGAAHAPIAAELDKCIPYNNRCVQNFIRIGWDLAVRGPKPVLSKNRERSSIVLAVNDARDCCCGATFRTLSLWCWFSVRPKFCSGMLSYSTDLSTTFIHLRPTIPYELREAIGLYYIALQWMKKTTIQSVYRRNDWQTRSRNTCRRLRTSLVCGVSVICMQCTQWVTKSVPVQ